MGEAVNGNLSSGRGRHDRMEWAPSPSGSVWRKRVHLVVLRSRAGHVVVRYEPRSRFPAHDHPRREILVLEGVFSEHGTGRRQRFS